MLFMKGGLVLTLAVIFLASATGSTAAKPAQTTVAVGPSPTEFATLVAELGAGPPEPCKGQCALAGCSIPACPAPFVCCVVCTFGTALCRCIEADASCSLVG